MFLFIMVELGDIDRENIYLILFSNLVKKVIRLKLFLYFSVVKV